MKAILQRVPVADGRLELSDPALDGVTEAEVVVLLPERSGDGEVGTPPASDSPLLTADEILSGPPSGRTAEEVDREIRDFRGDDS